jgi:hypothetical protein
MDGCCNNFCQNIEMKAIHMVHSCELRVILLNSRICAPEDQYQEVWELKNEENIQKIKKT